MARPINQIQQFRSKINQVLSALEDAQGAAQTIDYLGGITFYRDELNKTDEALTPHPRHHPRAIHGGYQRACVHQNAVGSGQSGNRQGARKDA